MTVWQLVEQLIWIIEVYITILKTAVLWQIVRQLGREYAFIDTNRVGIFGHSGGGMMAFAAICTYPDFYKVAVALLPGIMITVFITVLGERLTREYAISTVRYSCYNLS